MNNYNDLFMKEALIEAKKAFDKNEVPIGCVVVHNNEIIGRGHNLRESSSKTIDHAEILAINEACKNLSTWKLDNCEIYVTSEPCLMCTGTIIQARIKTLYFGCRDSKNGAIKSVLDIKKLELTHKLEFYDGFFEEECSHLLSAFFKQLR